MKDLLSIFPPQTYRRLALYDYISEHYPVDFLTLSKYKYYWNYSLLVKNEHICGVLKALVKVFLIEDYELRNNILPHSEDTQHKALFLKTIIDEKPVLIDLIFSAVSYLRNRQLDNLFTLFDEKYPDIMCKIVWAEKCFHNESISTSRNVFKLFIENLLSENTIDFSTEELIKLLKFSASLQAVLPVDVKQLTTAGIKVDWGKISQNKNFKWSFEIINQHKEEISWYELSLSYPFSEKEIYAFEEYIDWFSISKNVKVVWTNDLILRYKNKLNIHILLNNLNKDSDFKTIYHVAKQQLVKISYSYFDSLSAKKRGIILNDLPFDKPKYISFATNHIFSKVSDTKLGFYNPYVNYQFFLCFDPPRLLTTEQINILNISSHINQEQVEDYLYDRTSYHSLLGFRYGWVYLKENVKNCNKVDIISILKIHQIKAVYIKNKRPITSFEEICKHRSFTQNIYPKNLNYLFYENLNWDILSYHDKISYDFDLLSALENYLNWDLISMNPKVPFDLNILTKFEHLLNWHLISGLESSFWTPEILEKFAKRFVWGLPEDILDMGLTMENYRDYKQYRYCLSSNQSIPWSFDILCKFRSQIDWFQLSKNESVPWSEKILLEFSDELVFCQHSLFSNLSFFNLVIKPSLNNNLIANIIKTDKHPYQIIPKHCFKMFISWDYKEKEILNYLDSFYDLQEELLFGKHEGFKLKYIIDNELSYVIWMLENVEYFRLSLSALDYVDQIIYKLMPDSKEIQKYDKAKSVKLISGGIRSIITSSITTSDCFEDDL